MKKEKPLWKVRMHARKDGRGMFTVVHVRADSREEAKTAAGHQSKGTDYPWVGHAVRHKNLKEDDDDIPAFLRRKETPESKERVARIVKAERDRPRYGRAQYNVRKHYDKGHERHVQEEHEYRHKTQKPSRYTREPLARVNLKGGEPETARDHGIMAVSKALFNTRVRYRGPKGHRPDTLKRNAYGASIYNNGLRKEDSIDEISGELASRYIKKAASDARDYASAERRWSSRAADKDQSAGVRRRSSQMASDYSHMKTKRVVGITRAAARLQNEEELDEGRTTWGGRSTTKQDREASNHRKLMVAHEAEITRRGLGKREGGEGDFGSHHITYHDSGKHLHSYLHRGRVYHMVVGDDMEEIKESSPARYALAVYEQMLTELSRKTLKSYQRKATTDRDRAWARGDREEDKAMSTDGEKYPDKVRRHQEAATAAHNRWAKREGGLEAVRHKLEDKKRANKKLKESLLEGRGRPRKSGETAEDPDEHPIMQLKKAIALRGQHMFKFQSGKPAAVHPDDARRALDRHDSMHRPLDRAAYASRLGKSHDEFRRAVHEDELDELSRDTLGSYTKKAVTDLSGLRGDQPTAPKAYTKRRRGIDKAVDRLSGKYYPKRASLSKPMVSKYHAEELDEAQKKSNRRAWIIRAAQGRSLKKRNRPVTLARVDALKK